MRLACAALIGVSLISASVVADKGDSQRISAIRALSGFWATQASTLGGWLNSTMEPGFVPVVPPDSSLWSPGALLRVDPRIGFQPIGSSEQFLPHRKVAVLGKDSDDVAVLDSLVFGVAPEDRFRLEDLPGILEALGVLRMRSRSVAADLKGEFDRQGVRRLTILFPDAQVHRLAFSDLEAFLQNEASEPTRQLLAKPGVHMITSAIFLKTVQLRIEADRPSVHLKSSLEKILGSRLRTGPDGALDYATRAGMYVAIQTGERRISEGHLEFIDSTKETRQVLESLLTGLIGGER